YLPTGYLPIGYFPIGAAATGGGSLRGKSAAAATLNVATSAAVTIMTIFMMLIPLCWPPGRADRVTPLFRFVYSRRPLLAVPRSGSIAGGMAPDYLSPRPSNGSNVIGRIWTVVIGWDAGSDLNQPRQGCFQSERQQCFQSERQQGLLKLRFWPTPLDYILFAFPTVKARLEWLKGKKWGNPAGGDRILEARNR